MQFIHLIEGAYSKESCNDLIDFFETNIKFAAPGKAGNEKLNNLEICLGIDFNKPSSTGLEFVLSNMLSQYKEKFPLINSGMGEWYVSSSCQFAKFEPDNYYNHIHCEHGKTVPNRIFAWMMYLNDAKSGTEFMNYPTLRAKRGRCVVWPAGWTHVHRGVTPNKGLKYIITGWVSLKRVD